MTGALPAGPGAFVAVVGPSGSGKDTVMGLARELLADEPRVHFARRVITRPEDGIHEAHEPMDEPGFEALERAGAFALSWRAHGHGYGIAAVVDELVREGGVVVANLSRTVLEEGARRYERFVVVSVTVSDGERLRRLRGRGRDPLDALPGRAQRRVALPDGLVIRTIDNDGPAREAGGALAELIRGLLRDGVENAHLSANRTGM